jgi:helix-turn-helix protein
MDHVSRRIWTLCEPVHALTYFSAEALAAFTDAGLRGFWRGYFAGRSAPLGRVGAAPVTASFYNFAPAMVTRALPAVWELISPEQALAVRQAGAAAALRRVLADTGADVERVADLLTSALADLDCAGRVLASANAALPVPDDPYARLWQATTLLREHRGHGHFAALVAADLDGCEVLVLQSKVRLPREQIQPLRGWTDDEWDAAAARLTGRGLLASDGSLTETGTALRAEIEATTDRAAARPWHDQPLAAELAQLIRPITVACSAELPFPNPIGVSKVRVAG